jgi:hypothetical protein
MTKKHQTPSGYRLLKAGTVIKRGDIMTMAGNINKFNGIGQNNGWLLSRFVGNKVLPRDIGIVYYRKSS